MKATPVVLALVLAAASGSVPPARAADRLDAFRALVRGAADPVAADVEAAIHVLVDEEIIENLTAGGPFASEGFIQERLDAFAAAWGGARFTVRRVGDTLLGVYAGTGLGGAGSVRVFSGRPGHATLAAALTQEGEPELSDWPPAPGGRAQFALAWHGVAVSPGARAVEVQVWRLDRERVVRAWTTAEAFPDGLVASGLRLARGEVRLRYEARYPGRKPGCDGQTEHEDVYRHDAQAAVPRLIRRHVIEGWHRGLQEAVGRLFAALERRDERALARLVENATLRRRLPRALSADPASDTRLPDSPDTVSVAATEERPPARVPWSLRWRRQPGGWRVVGADPVLE